LFACQYRAQQKHTLSASKLQTTNSVLRLLLCFRNVVEIFYASRISSEIRRYSALSPKFDSPFCAELLSKLKTTMNCYVSTTWYRRPTPSSSTPGLVDGQTNPTILTAI